MTKITLRAGDYVSTEGMTEEQYHAVAKAFMEAGAETGEYPAWRYAEGGYIKLLGWEYGSGVFHADVPGSFLIHEGASEVRHLTITQVLGTDDEQDTVEALLAKADKHARKAAKHEDKRQECIDKARALMPEGWGIDDYRNRIRLGDEPKEDMSDPANWRAGDVVECVDNPCGLYRHTIGSLYTVVDNDNSKCMRFTSDELDCFGWNDSFRFHHRPA